MFWWEIYADGLLYLGGILGVILVIFLSVGFLFLIARIFGGLFLFLFAFGIMIVVMFSWDALTKMNVWFQIVVLLFAIISILVGALAPIALSNDKVEPVFPLGEFLINVIAGDNIAKGTGEVRLYDEDGDYKGTFKEE
jgi:hypothetical protein